MMKSFEIKIMMMAFLQLNCNLRLTYDIVDRPEANNILTVLGPHVQNGMLK